MLWTTENVFNITKVKTNTVWMWWLTPAVQHSGKLKQRQLWVQGQPGLCSHLLMQKSPSLPKVNLVWNGLHDTILNMSNTKMEPKNLHVGTWACEMARWVKGLPEFSLGTPCWKEKKDSCEHMWLWPGPSKCSTSQRKREPQWHLERFSLFYAFTSCLQWVWMNHLVEGTAYLPAAIPCAFAS